MSDSSEDDAPFQLRDFSEESDDERPSKRRKMARQPALRAKGLGFVSANAENDDHEEEEEENDPDDERPSMGMGMGMGMGMRGFRSDFNIGEYNDQSARKSPTPDMDTDDSAPANTGRGPSAFGAGGKIQKNSFAARMLAKQGYVEGQGLGKHGQGISAPIQTQVLQSRAGLGHGSTPDRPVKKKRQQQPQDKGKISQASTPGGTTPRIKAPPKAKYAVAAIESRGLHVPDSMRSIIVDATGAEAKTVSSLSGFSTPTSEAPPPSEAAKASARIRMQLQAYADAWDATKEDEARLDTEETQLQAAISLHESEGSRLRGIISEFERVSMDDSNEAREWEQIFVRLQEIQDKFSDYIEDLELPEIVASCLEAPFRRQLADWDPLGDATRFITAFQSIGALLELEKSTNSRHRKRTTYFESLLLQHWIPCVRIAVKEWDVYNPDAAVDLVTHWTSILPPWLLYKVLNEMIIPKLIETVRRFPKTVETTTRASMNGGGSSSSSKSRKAPSLYSWLIDWWPILSDDSLALERFPELRSLIKLKIDSQAWTDWKPLLGSMALQSSKPSQSLPATISTPDASAGPATPDSIAAGVEDLSFKDLLREWCEENGIILHKPRDFDALGRPLYRLQSADMSSKGILVTVMDDFVVRDKEGIPYELDEGLVNKIMGVK